MSRTIAVGIIILKTVILLFGSAITYVAYRAHRRTEAQSLRALAVGFGVVTVGSILAGIAHQVFGVPLRLGVLINSLLTALGFAIIVYSLYVER